MAANPILLLLCLLLTRRPAAASFLRDVVAARRSADAAEQTWEIPANGGELHRLPDGHPLKPANAHTYADPDVSLLEFVHGEEPRHRRKRDAVGDAPVRQLHAHLQPPARRVLRRRALHHVLRPRRRRERHGVALGVPAGPLGAVDDVELERHASMRGLA